MYTHSNTDSPVSYTHLDVYKRQIMDDVNCETYEKDSTRSITMGDCCKLIVGLKT